MEPYGVSIIKHITLRDSSALESGAEGVPGSPGESQKEGQEDHGEVKELVMTPPPLAVLKFPGPPGLLK